MTTGPASTGSSTGSSTGTGTGLGVYLVTDADQARRAGRDVTATVTAAVAGGVRTVQLRDKTATDPELSALLDDLAGSLPCHVRLLVNDRVELVRAAREAGVRVDGVHVGQTDMPVRAVRELLGPGAVVGVSASTPDQLRAAALDGADHVGIGAVRTTSTKPDAPPPLGLAGAGALAAVAGGLGLPAVAIGGLGADDLPTLRRAGFDGAAVVSAICAATDPAAAARRLVRAWEDGR